MNQLSEEIRSVGMDAGADMIGFAPVGRFDTGPEKTHPNYYMKQARSVVVAGIGYPRAIGEVWGTFAEDGGLVEPYMWFGFAYINWELSRVALRLAKTLETRGYRSLPIPFSFTTQYRYFESFDVTGQYLADFSHKHAALAAGLGTFGWSNLFLTPTYGARQRLISVITEAPLDAGLLMESQELCKPDLCGYACVETCPIGALSKDEAQEFIMEGHTYRYAVLDHHRCRWCLNGFTEGSGSRTHLEPPGKITQEDFARAEKKRDLADQGLFANAYVDFCGKCMHQCPSPVYDYIPKPIERYRDRTGCRTLARGV